MTGAVVVLWIALWVATVLVATAIGVAAGRRGAARRGDAAPTGPTGAPAARRRAALSEQVVDVSHTGVVVVDRDEFVVLVNPAARRLGVVERDRIAVPELADLARAVFRDPDPRTATITVESDRVGRAGNASPPPAVEALVAPIRLPGDVRPSAVALLVADITESRRLEAVRRDFVANVSHELKTPVGALILLAEAVQDASDDPEAVARFADRMQREGVRLGRLVRELIELSRLQGAEPLPGDEIVEVAEVIDDAVDAHRIAADREGITVLPRCPADLRVRGNRAQLAMAVSNLLENAVAYSPSGTRVGVTASGCTDARGAAVVKISVSDQGIGIADSDQERVFERFYRVDQARSRATGGTGLGLAIVKHVATNHGGAVSVWSREGSGSTFTITLPAAVPEPDTITDDAGPASAPATSVAASTRGTASA